jgi:hypothetical protein
VESPAHSNGHRHGSSNRVPVAQLIICCGEWRADRPPGVDYGPPASVSVGTLLRREGRAPHAADRPLQPRGHSRPPVGPKPPRRNVLRKATAAAGVLFVVAAMFATADVKNVAEAPRGGFDPRTRGGTAGDPSTGPSSDGGWVDARRVTLSVAEPSAATTPGVGSSVLLPITSGSEIDRGVSGRLRNAAAPEFGGAGGSAPPGGAGALTPAEPGAAEPVAPAPRTTGASKAPPLGAGSGSPAPGGLPPGLLPGILGPGVIAPGGSPGSDVPGSDVPGSDVPGSDVPGSDAPGSDVPGSRNAGSGYDSGRSNSNDSSRDDSSSGSSDRDDPGKPAAAAPAWPASWAGAERVARPRGLSPGG